MGVFGRRVAHEVANVAVGRIEEIVAPGRSAKVLAIREPKPRLELLARGRVERRVPADVHHAAARPGRDAGDDRQGQRGNRTRQRDDPQRRAQLDARTVRHAIGYSGQRLVGGDGGHERHTVYGNSGRCQPCFTTGAWN